MQLRPTLLLAVWVAAASSYLPAQIESVSKPRWVLVTTSELASELEPLALRRQQQGFEVIKVVRNAGIADTDWNDEFIRHRISESRAADRATFVLLVGDWTQAIRTLTSRRVKVSRDVCEML